MSDTPRTDAIPAMDSFLLAQGYKDFAAIRNLLADNHQLRELAKELERNVTQEAQEKWNQMAREHYNTTDPVNHPEHYKKGGIEAIDYMRAKSTPEEFKGHLRLTALKYLTRMYEKGEPLTDVRKAIWYLKKLEVVLTHEIPNQARRD